MNCHIEKGVNLRPLNPQSQEEHPRPMSQHLHKATLKLFLIRKSVHLVVFDGSVSLVCDLAKPNGFKIHKTKPTKQFFKLN